MQLKPRKDAPYEPVISRSECWAGLRLVEEILERIVSNGDAPEEVVERAHKFSLYVRALRQKHGVRSNAKDEAAWAAMYSAIAAGTLPTFRTTKSA
jgi:hypothetical protein